MTKKISGVFRKYQEFKEFSGVSRKLKEFQELLRHFRNLQQFFFTMDLFTLSIMC
jgi:hypothetical protein